MEKFYNFKKDEKVIYKRWEESGFFNPDNLNISKDAPVYTIVLPPPNITDKLHLGHSSMLAIEDLMIRFKRMNGYRTLWLPGTDHAAIATQNVVEKRIFKEDGRTRHDLGREKFLEKVWEFLRGTQSIILKQTRSMGASLDWSREAFTLDDKRIKAVRKMFVDMYKEGIIYKGERIVNWCPRCNSTLADDEMEYKDQKAMFYTFKYDKDFPIPISSTRPETKIGDTAVAVNPKDERYKKYIGQVFDVDFLGVKLNIRVIADWKVDMNFGTGALGVTPAHSDVDWQMAKENDLNIIKVIDEKGNIRDGFAEFSGKTGIEARKRIVELLKEKNLLIKEEEIENSLSVCYRCNTAIEPLPSKQWFISVDKKLERLGNKSLKEKAIEVARNGDINFVPSRFKKRYLDWMNNLHDWCISRQIWFGHRIPAWYCANCNKITVSEDEVTECIYCKSKLIVQDEDSLDTWFSSGMWTFSTLGWPDNYQNGVKTGDMKKFHPTQVLETGYDILTLWVSRMIIMSLFALEEIPFEDVYLHGMVLDKNGKKMSKSKGNGIDPIDMIEKFGTDAVRLALLIGNTPGNDVKVSEEKINSSGNFVNKLWNISKYILSYNKGGELQSDLFMEENRQNMTASDQWICSNMYSLISDITKDLDDYNFSQAGEKLRDFVWNELADWYIEASKFSESKVSGMILNEILKDVLKMLHPYIPFVTEKIWDSFNDSMLMVEKWPDNNRYLKIMDVDNDDNFEIIKNIISAIRNARAENKVEVSVKVKAVIYTKKYFNLVNDNQSLITSMKTGVNDLIIGKTGDKIKDAIFISLNKIKIYLVGAVDKDKERGRLNKKIEKLKEVMRNISIKLNNDEFIKKAPEKIVNNEKQKLKEYGNIVNNLKERLGKL